MGAPPLRIAITADPEIPVPPTDYGGIERIIDLLVRGLQDEGHAVTLFAHRDSASAGLLQPYPGRRSRGRIDVVRNTIHVTSAVLRGGVDLVHSFGRLAYLLPLIPSGLPIVMSYQRAITSRTVTWANRLGRGNVHFVGCSRHLIQRFAGLGRWWVVYNGVPGDAYRCRLEVAPDAPLVFLGRFEEIKGPHLAIDVARRTDRALILAGNVPDDPVHQAYFRERILPHVDGRRVSYLGPVDDAEKDRLLGSCSALLMPIQWEEPFGIVMAEALACGTPVIGLRRGSVPEVVEDGVNGFACDSVGEMVEAVGRVGRLSRSACRRTMEERFSDRAVVAGYSRLYERALGRA